MFNTVFGLIEASFTLPLFPVFRRINYAWPFVVAKGKIMKSLIFKNIVSTKTLAVIKASAN